jgi:hypothetical protein
MGMVIAAVTGFVAFVCSIVFVTAMVSITHTWIDTYGLMTVGFVAGGGVVLFTFVALLADYLSRE